MSNDIYVIRFTNIDVPYTDTHKWTNAAVVSDVVKYDAETWYARKLAYIPVEKAYNYWLNAVK